MFSATFEDENAEEEADKEVEKEDTLNGSQDQDKNTEEEVDKEVEKEDTLMGIQGDTVGLNARVMEALKFILSQEKWIAKGQT